MTTKRRKTMAALKKWLQQSGAEVLEPTNPYELVRFVSGGVTSIIYTRRSGRLTFTGEAQEAWDACFHGGPWRPKVRKTRRRRPSVRVRALLERDGRRCFFCGYGMDPGTETVEHLVPAGHGGPDHLSNQALAHAECNGMAKALSVPEKLALRDRLRWRKLEDAVHRRKICSHPGHSGWRCPVHIPSAGAPCACDHSEPALPPKARDDKTTLRALLAKIPCSKVKEIINNGS